MTTPENALASQIRNIERQYGRSMGHWSRIIERSGLTKHNDVVAMLKVDHGMTHGAAHRVSLVSRGAGRRDEGAEADRIEALFQGRRAQLRPLYDKLILAILRFGDDIQMVPKKRYVSIRRGAQFAMIQPATATRIDLGLILKGTPTTSRFESSQGWNSLFTHRVRITEARQIDAALRARLRDAYDNAGRQSRRGDLTQ
jgi:hypothetical protein